MLSFFLFFLSFSLARFLSFFLFFFASLILRWDQSIVTDVSEPEVKVKPVPRPRSKTQPKALPSTNSNILECAEEANGTSNAQVSVLLHSTQSESRRSVLIAMIALSHQVSHYYECPADSTRPKPLRPPPKPPSPASNKSPVCHLNSNADTSLEVTDNFKAELRTSVPCMPSLTDG